jgi:peptidoglycan/xylan/chitin deacetylase (PgdA/CDA1 family)
VAASAVAALRPQLGKRVILLHDVKRPDHLREKIAWLLAGYEIVALPDLFSRPQGRRTQVALTFDDGYRSWYDEAAPILEEFSVPAVFFVCSGFIGLRGEAARVFAVQRLRRHAPLEPLDVPQLRALAANPLFEVGSHTVNHVDLGAVTDRGALVSEIGGDRRRLEDWIGSAVRWFAYPFGQPENTSAASRAYIEAQGFERAFTIVPSFAGGPDRFAVGRDSLEMTDPHWVWGSRLAGGYDALYRIKRRMRAYP